MGRFCECARLDIFVINGDNTVLHAALCSMHNCLHQDTSLGQFACIAPGQLHVAYPEACDGSRLEKCYSVICILCEYVVRSLWNNIDITGMSAVYVRVLGWECVRIVVLIRVSFINPFLFLSE